MDKPEETELNKSIVKLVTFWLADRGHVQSLTAFMKSIPAVSKKTGLTKEELIKIYRFLNRKMENLILDDTRTDHKPVTGFRPPSQGDTPTKSG